MGRGLVQGLSEGREDSKAPFRFQPKPLLFDESTHLVFDALLEGRRKAGRRGHRDDLSIGVEVGVGVGLVL